ncbi:YceI family protein [soil metagenome]
MSTTKWTLDPMHSEIGFKIKHLMITNVSGSFGKFEVTAETNGDDFSSGKISFSAEISSINTGSDQRDGHLKSADFFDMEKFPEIKFIAQGMESIGSDEYKLNGDLTIRDVTRPIQLQVEMGGIVKDPYGNTKAGFTLTGKINRKEFGLTWNAATETGGVLVSEDVKIQSEIQLVKQA